MINFLIRVYQRYSDIRFCICRKIFIHFYKKAYSQLYRYDEMGIQYFSKKKQTGINEIIEEHLKKDEYVIMDKLEDYIF